MGFQSWRSGWELIFDRMNNGLQAEFFLVLNFSSADSWTNILLYSVIQMKHSRKCRGITKLFFFFCTYLPLRQKMINVDFRFKTGMSIVKSTKCLWSSNARILYVNMHSIKQEIRRSLTAGMLLGEGDLSRTPGHVWTRPFPFVIRWVVIF